MRIYIAHQCFLCGMPMGRGRLSLAAEFGRIWPNLADEGDNLVLELAVAGHPECIVTYNVRDFAHAGLRFPGLQIVTFEYYCDVTVMATLTIRLLEDKHARLKALAKRCGISVKIDGRVFDPGAGRIRFGNALSSACRAASHNKGLGVLDRLDGDVSR